MGKRYNKTKNRVNYTAIAAVETDNGFSQKEKIKKPQSNKTPNTRILDRFEYYLEDMDDCKLCLYWRKGTGCSRSVCCCEEERAEAAANGRIKRRDGWNKWQG